MELHSHAALGDVVLDGSKRCSNSVAHQPGPRLLVHHHSIPESWGGTAADTLLCPTCHMNTHVLIDQYVRAGGDPGWAVRRQFNPYIRQLALRAWEHRPANPRPTL